MSTSVPLVLNALVSTATTALPAGSQIVLATVMPAGYMAGPGEVTGVTSGVTLEITGVRFLMDQYAELGPNYKHEEHYNIACSLIAWAGDPNFTQRMLDVYTCYADLQVAISQNMVLGLTDPVPRIAWPRQLSFTPGPDAFGRPAGTIDFEIEVQARVNSLS